MIVIKKKFGFRKNWFQIFFYCIFYRIEENRGKRKKKKKKKIPLPIQGEGVDEKSKKGKYITEFIPHLGPLNWKGKKKKKKKKK